MYYPISVELESRLVAVVGGGAVGERKVETLLSYGARIRLISPSLTPRLTELASSGRLEHLARSYQAGDAEGCVLAFACADHPEVNKAVYRDAYAAGVPVNVADSPAQCSFLVPAVLRRGDLTVAVSTQGRSPALARRLRDDLSQVIGPEYEQYLSLLGDFRVKIKGKYPDQESRLRAYARFLDSDILDLLREGRPDAARERITECT